MFATDTHSNKVSGQHPWAHEPDRGVMLAVGRAISAAPPEHGVLVHPRTGEPLAIVPLQEVRHG